YEPAWRHGNRLSRRRWRRTATRRHGNRLSRRRWRRTADIDFKEYGKGIQDYRNGSDGYQRSRNHNRIRPLAHWRYHFHSTSPERQGRRPSGDSNNCKSVNDVTGGSIITAP